MQVVRYRPQRPVGMSAPERGAGEEIQDGRYRRYRRSFPSPSDDEAELLESVEMADLAMLPPSDVSDDEDLHDSSIRRLGKAGPGVIYYHRKILLR